MLQIIRLIVLLLLSAFGLAYHYDPDFVAYNLNTNKSAEDPNHYWGQREVDHTYHPSPANWRFPFYTLFLDRFVNGDPSNDNSNGTKFEHDLNSNQIRHGGDVRGLLDSLDYLQGMGVKGLYIAGSVLINAPWTYDSYSPLDLSLLDSHFGDLELWKSAIDEIHRRNMYVILDNTFATLGDLIGFDGHLNSSAPFTFDGYPAVWKGPRRYHDFDISDRSDKSCDLPRFYNETGFPVGPDVTQQLKSCYTGDFDQYGDTEAFGVYPDWRRQLTKFASVQDRLAEWKPSVREKIQNFYCMMIAQLDIDGFRYDKALQSTVDALASMNEAMRTCARRFGKNNFFLPGEITGGNQIGSVWIGRGRQPDMLPSNLSTAITSNQATQAYSIRKPELSALDSAAFHYSTYRALTRFLGLDGNLNSGYDTPVNFVDMWNTFLLTNDMTNANTGEFDPRHMFGVGNQDVFRWPAIVNGTERQLLGHFITILLLPGVPLLLWGEEQEFYVLDSTADNYIFGRQPMSAASAWQTHGCYALGSTQYYQWPVDAARNGCRDNKVSYDHRDPSAPVRNILKHMFHLRENFVVLNDGMWLEQLSNQTRQIFKPGSSGVATEIGIWSVVRSGVPGIQGLDEQLEPPVWLLFSNEETAKTFNFNCSDDSETSQSEALLAPYESGTVVRNLLHPYDTLILSTSSRSLDGNNNSTRRKGCLSNITMKAYGHGAYVPAQFWTGPKPSLTKFFVDNNEQLGHDSRLVSRTTEDGTESIPITLYLSSQVDCQKLTDSISITSKTKSGRSPIVMPSSAYCKDINSTTDRQLQGSLTSVFSWQADLAGVENGVHRITVGNNTKDSIDHFLIRVGQDNNPVVFPRSANYSSTLVQRNQTGDPYLHHTAAGADLWRYSTNWGTDFTAWMPYSGEVTPLNIMAWAGTNDQAWKGTHVIVEYFSRLLGTSDIVVEGDVDFDQQRRFPHLFWNGPYNQFGYDAGLENSMRLMDHSTWSFDFLTEWPAVAQINVWGINPDGKPDQSYVM